MNYVCIRCGKTWAINNGDLDPAPSGSLCRPCLRKSLIPLFRKRQLREGNFDCFGKANYYCDQVNCKYKNLCVKVQGEEEVTNG